MMPLRFKKLLYSVAVIGIGLLFPKSAETHCDTLDSPLIKDAQLAIIHKDVTPILKWVNKEDESEVRTTFKKSLDVRSKGRDAKEIADTYFFETLIRLHRAGEGEPFTGLKPEGTQKPAFIEADRALETGSIDFMIGHLTTEVETGIRQRFLEALEKRADKDKSVDAGRDYVKAYVSFLHYIERLTGIFAAESEHP